MTQVAQQPQRQWMYNQRTGQLRNPDGQLDRARGYSGVRAFVNNPAAEAMAFQGPIPRGAYIVGRDTGTRGPRTLVLDPDGHRAHDRTELRIHGDSLEHPGDASTGCIILNRRQRDAIQQP